jgi:hypothetical protein
MNNVSTVFLCIFLGLIQQIVMSRGDPGNCQVTLDHLTLATVLPASCHGLMYVSESQPCLCICVYMHYPFLFDSQIMSCSKIVENDALQ